MLDSFVETFRTDLIGHARYTWEQLTQPSWDNFYYWLAGLSLAIWIVEITLPWRRQQHMFRRDFWLDATYVAINMVVFPAAGFVAAGAAVWSLVAPALDSSGLADGLLPVKEWPVWIQLAAMFVAIDFVQWNIHRLLHRVPLLWEFHKTHHSVKQMGVAAHLRYHWMENVVYKSLQAIPIAALGFSYEHFIPVAVLTLAIGHLNHANLYLPLGPLRYVLNSPQMHIWHHAKHLPAARSHGVNFGLTLSLWDWAFGTAWWPSANGSEASRWTSGRDAELGFTGDETFPERLIPQLLWPLRRSDQNSGG